MSEAFVAKKRVVDEYLGTISSPTLGKNGRTMMFPKVGKTVLSFTDEIGYTEFRVDNEWLVRAKAHTYNLTNAELFRLAVMDDASKVDY